MDQPPPVLNIDNIQGRSLLGFNKDHFRALIWKIPDGADIPKIKSWLRDTVLPLVQNSTAREVMSYRARLKAQTSEVVPGTKDAREARRAAVAVIGGQKLVEISFSWNGTARLIGDDANGFSDLDPFRVGFPLRSAYLGDGEEGDGAPNNGKFGRSSDDHDIMAIIECDTEYDVIEVNDKLKVSSYEAGLSLTWEQIGQKEVDGETTNMFKFRDGVSQPDVYGTYYVTAGATSGPTEKLWKETIAPTDFRAEHFGIPGNNLIWPGEFIFGYRRATGDIKWKPAIGRHDNQSTAEGLIPGVPKWAIDGTYQVFRRLTMKTGRFRTFLNTTGAQLNVSPDYVGALLFGRWANGEPIVRWPGVNTPGNNAPGPAEYALGANPDFRNNFTFIETYGLAPLRAGKVDPFPPPVSDPLGAVCPFASHIRKVNPRDSTTDQGGPAVTDRHRILRRASNFGKDPLPCENPDEEDQEDRGLLFFAYQTDLQDQFEFLQHQWANSVDAPIPGGIDPIIGQNSKLGENRVRKMTVNIFGITKEIVMPQEFVVPTGSGYFFTPSVTSLKDVFTV